MVKRYYGQIWDHDNECEIFTDLYPTALQAEDAVYKKLLILDEIYGFRYTINGICVFPNNLKNYI